MLVSFDKLFSLVDGVNTYVKKSYRGAHCNDKLHGEKSVGGTPRN